MVARRAGQLTTAWQIMVAIAWSAAFFAFAGVWKASEEIGIATWWLGPRADPQPVPIRIIPFVIAVGIALLAVYNLRIVPWVSLAGSAVIAVIAGFDVSRSVGLAVTELAIAGALALVSAASFGGRYRIQRADRPAPDPADAEQRPSPGGPPGAG